MKLKLTTALAASIMATAAFADGHAGSGDPAKGEKDFRKCKACHMIQDADGTNIVKGGKTGPNLYGIAGRAAGTVEKYRYGTSIVQAGEEGLVWTEEVFVAYLVDPKKFLQEHLDDPKARSKMSFRLKSGGDDIWAYLVSVGPEIAVEEAEAEATEAEVSN